MAGGRPLALGGLEARPLRWADWRFCWRLAADPAVRAASFDPRPPSPLRHLRWMRRHCGRRDGLAGAWIVEHFDAPLTGRRSAVALVSWQLDGMVGPVATWSGTGGLSAWLGIGVLARLRGLRIGVRALRAVADALREDYPGIVVRACVKPENASSLAAFRHAGFRVHAFQCRHQHRAWELAWPS